MLSLKNKIPQKILEIITKLNKAGFKAYLVGGCVRDLLRKEKAKDWDIATSALPQKIKELFPKHFATEKFGTVTVITQAKDKTLKEVEITPFRKEFGYSDRRHPDRIEWAKTIEQDLKRRDFTINSMALEVSLKRPQFFKLIDPFFGKKDLENKIIRAVRDPQERFSEDALRMVRAVRFAVTLSKDKIWKIEQKTEKAIKKNSFLIKEISKERIRDEFLKIISAKLAARGIEILRRVKLLKYLIPELEEGFGVWQNKHHIYQVYQHNLLSLNYACLKNFPIEVRLASLFHDIGKPKTKRGEGPDATFYGHEIVGAKMTKKILERLRFPKKQVEKITKLVRYHLFYYNVGEVGPSSVRRLLRKVGKEDIEALLQVRMADRIGSGLPKAEPYRLRHLRYMIEKVSQDPISVKMLKVSGYDVMEIAKIKPSPKVGWILDILLAYVLENPKKNKKEILIKEIKKLAKLSDNTLKELSKKARVFRDKIEIKRDEMTKKKYWLI